MGVVRVDTVQAQALVQQVHTREEVVQRLEVEVVGGTTRSSSTAPTTRAPTRGTITGARRGPVGVDLVLGVGVGGGRSGG